MNSSGCPRPYDIECEVWGTEGTVRGDNTRDTFLMSTREKGYKEWETLEKETMAKAIENEIGHFVECVQQDKTPLIDGVDGAKTIATGQPVKVRNEF